MTDNRDEELKPTINRLQTDKYTTSEEQFYGGFGGCWGPVLREYCRQTEFLREGFFVGGVVRNAG
jgi:hypothetical protein